MAGRCGDTSAATDDIDDDLCSTTTDGEDDGDEGDGRRSGASGRVFALVGFRDESLVPSKVYWTCTRSKSFV